MKFDAELRERAKTLFREYNGWFPVAAIALVVAVAILDAASPGLLGQFLSNLNYNAVSLSLAGVILIATIVSYPRVYKLKVLLSGFMAVSIFLMVFLARTSFPFHSLSSGAVWDFYASAQKLPSFTARFLSLLFALNLLAIMIVPSRVNYTAGRVRSVLPLIVNLLVWVLVIFSMAAFVETQAVRGIQVFFILYAKWIVLAIFIATAVLSWFRIEEDHNFGAVLVSIALVMLVAAFNPKMDARFLAFLLLMGALLLAGIVYHVLESLKYGARIDPLLKIWNRQYMGAIVSGVAEIHLGSKFSVLISDIDHFKHVNDTYGHQAGDAVLYEVAQCIRKSAEPEGIACRYGGEEIIIFLKNLTGKEAKEKAEAIRKAIEKMKIKYQRRRIPVTTSIGVASKEGGAKTVEQLIQEADKGLYEAKRTGRNKVVAS
ncbi:MAG: GGDEF domain-containing protein [Spirochaetes bacterium]|nr:GGDEF domain-containing protein [Spirochaetota bacterium]